MVFQNYALYPHMSVYENMSFGLRLRKTPKVEIKRRVEEAANILNIHAQAFCKALTGLSGKLLSPHNKERGRHSKALCNADGDFCFA